MAKRRIKNLRDFEGKSVRAFYKQDNFDGVKFIIEFMDGTSFTVEAYNYSDEAPAIQWYKNK